MHDAPPDEPAIAAIYASIGRQIRDARVARGWYQPDLAERANLSNSVICRLELARRPVNLHQLIIVSALLSRRPSDLLRVGEDDAYPLGHAPWPAV